MVDPDQVDQFEQMSEARDPPAVAVAGHGFPVVQRIAPELTRGAEIVRRYTGHHDRLTSLVEFEQVLVRPHVRTVVGHEDRNVAHDGDSEGTRFGAHGSPLLGE